MNRNEAIEQAAQAVIERWETPNWKDVPATANYIYALREALALPKDCDLIFWNGPKYSFYTESLEMGEQIVKHLPNSDDFTATELSPQADADGCAVCGEVYQVVGALWNGQSNLVPVLDNLSASATGKPIPHDTLLPFVPKSDAERVCDLLNALEELADLVDDIRSGEYVPDSFTTQPARLAIAKAKGGA